MTQKKGFLSQLFTSTEKIEIPLDEIKLKSPDVQKAMQDSLTAYYKTHGLRKDSPLHAGLTIPFFAITPDENNMNVTCSGHLIATGQMSDKNRHIFNVHIMSLEYTHGFNVHDIWQEPRYSQVTLTLVPDIDSNEMGKPNYMLKNPNK